MTMESDPKTARELLAAASPRPWRWDSSSKTFADAALLRVVSSWPNGAVSCGAADQDLIVYAVNNLEQLLDRVDVLEAALEWYGFGGPGHPTPNGHCGDYGERARSALRGSESGEK